MRRLFPLAAVAAAGCAQFHPPPEGVASGDDDSPAAGRCAIHGYPYTYADEHGSTVTPDDDLDGTPFRVAGTLARGDEVFAGVGLSFAEPKQAFDASRYQGITFAARRSATGTPFVRFKVPDVNTDPDGKVCTDCYNDFGIPFEVGEAWTRFEVRFADLAQEADWGAPRPAAVDAAHLYGVQWQVATAGAAYDLEVDDLAFLGCQGD